MASFTTWTALLATIKDDIANLSVTRKSYTIGDTTTTFRSVKEAWEHYYNVKPLADAETTSTAPAGRTFLKNGGR